MITRFEHCCQKSFFFLASTCDFKNFVVVEFMRFLLIVLLVAVQLSLARPPPTKFIVLTEPRSGSAHLCSLLGADKRILMADELFAPVAKWRSEMSWQLSDSTSDNVTAPDTLFSALKLESALFSAFFALGGAANERESLLRHVRRWSSERARQLDVDDVVSDVALAKRYVSRLVGASTPHAGWFESSGNVDAVGFKLFPAHIDVDDSALIEWLASSDASIRVVYLYRRDAAASVLSLLENVEAQQADERFEWHRVRGGDERGDGDRPSDLKFLSLLPSMTRSRCKRIDVYRAEGERRLGRQRWLSIGYDELVSREQRTLRRVKRFLLGAGASASASRTTSGAALAFAPGRSQLPAERRFGARWPRIKRTLDVTHTSICAQSDAPSCCRDWLSSISL
jgi:hypothetical protein